MNALIVNVSFDLNVILMFVKSRSTVSAVLTRKLKTSIPL